MAALRPLATLVALTALVPLVPLFAACPPKPEQCDRIIENGGEGEGEGGEGEGANGDAPAPPPPQECFADSDCLAGQFCDASTATCVGNVGGVECTQDADCGRDFVCDAGKCVAGGVGSEPDPNDDVGNFTVTCFLATDGKYDCDCGDFHSFRSDDFCELDDFNKTALDECGL